jgi:hypothetical protein
MSDYATRSFWLGRLPYEPGPALDGDTRADVVIMGGGFTGLWSAIHLKDADPSLDIVVLEREVIGYGASGRNGGFAMTMVERNIAQLLRRVGPEQAKAQHLAMVDALQQLVAFTEREGIDATITAPGLLTVSNGPEQDVRIQQDLEAAASMGLDDFQQLDRAACQELLHSDKVRCGHWEDSPGRSRSHRHERLRACHPIAAQVSLYHLRLHYPHGAAHRRTVGARRLGQAHGRRGQAHHAALPPPHRRWPHPLGRPRRHPLARRA